MGDDTSSDCAASNRPGELALCRGNPESEQTAASAGGGVCRSSSHPRSGGMGPRRARVIAAWNATPATTWKDFDRARHASDCWSKASGITPSSCWIPTGSCLPGMPAQQRFKGYKADEIIGQHFSRFYPPEALARGLPEHELKVASETGVFEDEGWRVRQDGTLFWANVVITAVRDSHGQLIGFAKVTRDLTQRRSHEEDLRRSEERFRLLIEGVSEYAIFMLDPNGKVATWNVGAEKIKGYKASEIIGQHFSDVLSGGSERGPVARARAAGSRGTGQLHRHWLAPAQGWHDVLGQCHDHCASRRYRQAPWLRQAHPRPDRDQAS